MYSILKTSNYYFAIYHLHYKDKFVNNLTRVLVYTIDNFYFWSNFDNFLVAFPLFTSNYKACAVEQNLVIKKRELLKTSSIYTTDT